MVDTSWANLTLSQNCCRPGPGSHRACVTGAADRSVVGPGAFRAAPPGRPEAALGTHPQAPVAHADQYADCEGRREPPCRGGHFLVLPAPPRRRCGCGGRSRPDDNPPGRLVGDRLIGLVTLGQIEVQGDGQRAELAGVEVRGEQGEPGGRCRRVQLIRHRLGTTPIPRTAAAGFPKLRTVPLIRAPIWRLSLATAAGRRRSPAAAALADSLTEAPAT